MPATNIRRGKIVKSVVTGVSAEYYRRLSTTPISELVSGNLTKSPNKNILRVIAAEVQKSRKLHDNVLLEMQLMQDCGGGAASGLQGEYGAPGLLG